MPRFSNLFGSCWYYKVDGTPMRVTSEELFGLPEQPLCREPAVPSSATSLPTTQSRLNDHITLATQFVQDHAETPHTVPLVFNVESYAAKIDGGARIGGAAFQSNLRAIVEIIKHVRRLCPGRRLGCYCPGPRWDFFQTLGAEPTGIDQAVMRLYEDEQAMNLRFLAPHVDFFVIDCYVRWGLPPNSLAVPPASIWSWLRANTDPINKYWYGRYPGQTVTAVGYGLHYGGDSSGSQWLAQFIQQLTKQVEYINKYALGRPWQAWTSSQMLNNGTRWNNDNSTTPADWENPIWQLLMTESQFRSVLDAIHALKPESCVLFEGWSDERNRISGRVGGPPTTDPATPWAGSYGGGLEWDDSLSIKHPYLLDVIDDYKPL